MTIGEKIRAVRKSKGLTQKALGGRMGVTQATVGQYETNPNPPKIETLQNIAAALGVQVTELLGEDDADREYELLCDTLESVGFKIEQGIMADEFIISHADDQEPPEERETVEYGKLVEIVNKVLKDAEANKKEYIRKRLELELFWPEGVRPKEQK